MPPTTSPSLSLCDVLFKTAGDHTSYSVPEEYYKSTVHLRIITLYFTTHTKKAVNGNFITITQLEKPGTKLGMWAFNDSALGGQGITTCILGIPNSCLSPSLLRYSSDFSKSLIFHWV